MNTGRILLGVGLGWLALFAGEGRGQAGVGDPTLERARGLYSPEQWPRGERRDGFVLEELVLPGLSGGEVEFRASEVARRYADAKGVARVLVEMSVGETAAESHAALLRHVAYVQSPRTLSTAASRGIRAGDVGYVAYGGRDGSKVAWIAFAVGNLEFRVVNLEPDASGAAELAPIVALLADRAASLPVLPAGDAVSKPQIPAFSADRTSVPAGESALLDIVATDPTGRAARFEFEVGGPGHAQGYVEQDEQGRWRFHATGPGRTKLTLRVLGRNGTTATKSIDLEVTPS